MMARVQVSPCDVEWVDFESTGAALKSKQGHKVKQKVRGVTCQMQQFLFRWNSRLRCLWGRLQNLFLSHVPTNYSCLQELLG